MNGTAKTSVISLCANQQDCLGPIKTVKHPSRPPFFRSAILVLVYPGVYTVLTKSLGKRQNCFCVLRGIVTVADKNFGG